MFFAIDEFKFEIFAPMNFISPLLQYLDTLKKNAVESSELTKRITFMI